MVWPQNSLTMEAPTDLPAALEKIELILKEVDRKED